MTFWRPPQASPPCLSCCFFLHLHFFFPFVFSMALFQAVLSFFLPFISSSLFFLYMFPPALPSTTPSGLASSIVFFSFSASCPFVPTLFCWSLRLPPHFLLVPSQTLFSPQPATLEGILSSQEWLEVRTELGEAPLGRPPRPSI